MLTPADHRILRNCGRLAVLGYVGGLMNDDTLTDEGLESYAAGMTEGLVGCLTRYCTRAAAVEALASAVERFPSLRAELDRALAQRFEIPRDADLHTFLDGQSRLGETP